MRSLLVYLKQYKKESILAPLFKMLEASFELLVPLVMAAVIDVGIAHKDSGYIIRMCLLLIALGLIGLVCSITAQYFSAKAAAGFGAGVRHALFAHIQSFSFTEMDTIGTSTLITRMTSDINQVQSGVNLVLRLFLRSPFIVFGAMVMAFTVDVKAALVFVAAIPLLSVIVFGVMLITMPLYRNVQSRLDQVLLAARENLTGARVIRAFNQEDQEKERFYTANQRLTDAQKFAGRISGLMNPLTYVIVNGAIVVLIYIGAVRVNIGDLTQGEVVALLNYMSQILVELVKLANLIITVTKAVACANRIEKVLLEKPDMKEGSLQWDTAEWEESQENEKKQEKPFLEFSHVSLTYKGAAGEALTDISFRAERGQTIGVIGGTGSGKSSLVNLIPRFYDATEGMCPSGRKRRERISDREPAGSDRSRAPEGSPVPGNDRGESALGKSAGFRSGAAGGASDFPGGGVCREERRRSARAGGTGRKKSVRRTEAASYHCQGAGEKTGDPDPGRQRFCSGFCYRCGASESHCGDEGTAACIYCFPAGGVHLACGSDPCTGRRQTGGTGHP